MSAKIKSIPAASLTKLELATHRRQTALFANKVNVLLRAAQKAPPNTTMMAFVATVPGGQGEAGQVIVYGGGGPPHHMFGGSIASLPSP